MTSINDNFRMALNFKNNMRVEGMFQLQYNYGNTVKFMSPSHPMYVSVEDTKKGNYSNTTNKNLSYTGNIIYSWTNKIGKHAYTVNGKADMKQSNTTNVIWAATGYPRGTNGNPSFANNYVDARPGYSNPITRQVNFLVTGSYSYDNRFLFDATFNEAGSTVFGAAKKFQPAWAAGIGWNMHEEQFLRGFRQINTLRLKGTVGLTGNQNVTSTNSTSIYSYQTGGNFFGPGVTVSQLGNPNVEWQQTHLTNFSLDLNMFDSRLMTNFQLYQKRTTPLVVGVDQAPSTGAKSYPMSVGSLTTKGFEYDVSYQLIRTENLSWRVQVKGSMYNSVYAGFGDKLANMDKLARESSSLQRYRDGYSPNTLWAVRSLGIDPASGNEIFLDRFGNPTMVWDVRDEMACGEGYPKTSGSIVTSFTMKQFTISLAMFYAIQQQRSNKQLFDKVENISYQQVAYNQDKRALNDRWQNVGDRTQFKNIALASEQDMPHMSSRFIQTENSLTANTVTVTWRVPQGQWMKNLRMERLDLRAEASGSSGVFRLTNVLVERGVGYPEGYRFALTIDATF